MLKATEYIRKKVKMKEKDNKELQTEQKIKIAKEHQKKWLKIKIIIYSISTLIGLIILLIAVNKH